MRHRRQSLLLTALMLSVLLLSTTAAGAAPINLTGTWQPKVWTLKIALQQEGDSVWGHGGAKDFWFRGHWEGNRLLLVANNFKERPFRPMDGAFSPRESAFCLIPRLESPDPLGRPVTGFVRCS